MKPKKPISKLSGAVGLMGLAVIGISIAQWFFRYPDLGQLSVGAGIGICFIVFSYIYNWMRNKNEDDLKRDKRIDNIVKYYTKEEWKE